jgi:transcriptional regulator GlxA family with amidase domain
VEVLDFAGPFEVFSTASRLRAREDPQAPALFRVCTIALQKQLVAARGGLNFLPDFSIHSHPQLDVLIIPGGIVTAELEKEEVIDWIARISNSAKLTASVCTGAFLLGQAGLLEGKQATTHWEDLDDLRAMFPGIEVLPQTSWVDNGQIVTSAGISAGIDMSLHLVERLADRDLAVRTAHQMEFDWQPA